MFGRGTRNSNSIRFVAQYVLPTCVACLAFAFYVKVWPQVRRANAYNDVWCAAITDEPNTLLAALQAGGDPNARNPAHEPALMVAAHNGNTTCVRMLLRFGANPNIRGSSDATPLIHATLCGRTDVIALLLQKGADPNLAASNGDTPLMVGARVGIRESVRLLLNGGANTSLRNNAGATPLTIAESNGHPDVAAMLRQAGERK